MMTKNFRNCRGATAVEFAIVIIVFFLLLFGIIDFGWLAWNHLVVNNAAREGARMAILNCEDPYQVTLQDVEDKIREMLRRGALFSAADNATISVSPMNCGQPVSVEVHVPFQFFLLPQFAGIVRDRVEAYIVMIHEP